MRTIVIAAFAGALSACAVHPRPVWTPDTLFGVTSEARDYGDFLSARYAGMVGDAAVAADYYRRAFERSPHDASALENAALAYLVSGEVAQAVELAQRAHPAVAANSPASQLALAINDFATGKTADTAGRLATIRAGSLNAEVVQYLSAWLASTKDVDTGVALLADRSAARGRNDEANVVRALILSTAGRTQEALDAVRAGPSLRTAPAFQAALHARLLAAMGDRQGALDLLAEHMDDAGPHPETGILAEAIKAGETITAPRYTLAQGAAAAIHVAATGRYARLGAGVAAMRHALALYADPGLDASRLALAEAMRDQDRLEAAADVLRGVPEGSPLRADAQLALAWVLTELGRRDAALAPVQEAVRLSRRRDVLVGAGDVFRGLEHFAEAEENYDAAVSADAASGRKDWRVLFARAAARERLGRWRDAEADLVAALAIEPDRPELLNFLGYGWVDRGSRVEEGLEMIRTAAAAMPDAGYIIDSLGWAYYRLGRYEDAVEQLERAAELSPGDIEIVDHLGDAYWRAGREIEAGFQWKRALTFSPDAAMAATLSAKLASGLSARTNQAAAAPGRSLP